jgi:peroxiredoxin Q/BCP
VVFGISVDSPAQNRAMIEKLLLPFSLLSDPDGRVSRLYGVWHDEQAIARPAIFVVVRDGTVRFMYVGEDFADRPGDEPLWQALEETPGATR